MSRHRRPRNGPEVHPEALDDDAIRRRDRQRRLRRQHQGAYAMGHEALTPAGHRMAAVLAGGPGTVLGIRNALAAHGLRETTGTTIDILVGPNGREGDRDGLRIRRSRTLRPEHVTWVDGVPCTTVARTLVDAGLALPTPQVARAFAAAERARTLDRDAIHAVLAVAGSHRGVHPLREVLRAHDPRWAPLRSELEIRMLELLTASGLPQPAVDEWVINRYIADFIRRDRKLIVEVDGQWSHGTANARRRDARRDRALRAAGYRVLRFTWADVTRRPAWVLARIATALSA